jgi:type IV fimbrial biogenesis protein FimT
LLELMVTVAVVAILLTIGIPSYQTTIRGNCAVSTANSLLALMTLARSEAERRSQTVTICPSSDGSTCSGSNAAWAAGAMAFSDINGNGALDSGETILKVIVPLSSCATVQSNLATNYLGFDGSGRLSTQGTFGVTPKGLTTALRNVIVSSPSKLRICNPTQDTTTCGQ